MSFIELSKALCMLSGLINTDMLKAAVKSGVQVFVRHPGVYNEDMLKTLETPSLKEADACRPSWKMTMEKLFFWAHVSTLLDRLWSLHSVARFQTVYGPSGGCHGWPEKAPAAVCRKVIEAKVSSNEEIDAWGPGNQTYIFCSLRTARKASI